MLVDGSHNTHKSGLCIFLISPEGLEFEHNIWINYNSLNNEVKYKALITWLQKALLLHIEYIKVLSDSHLVVIQVLGEYVTREPNLIKYLEMVKYLQWQFIYFHISHLLRDDNRHANSLAYLGSKIYSKMPSTITIEVWDVLHYFFITTCYYQCGKNNHD